MMTTTTGYALEGHRVSEGEDDGGETFAVSLLVCGPEGCRTVEVTSTDLDVTAKKFRSVKVTRDGLSLTVKVRGFESTDGEEWSCEEKHTRETYRISVDAATGDISHDCTGFESWTNSFD